MKNIDVTCIIDDDPIFSYGVQKIMEHEKFCFSFLIYKDGKEALDGLLEILRDKKKVPDLILLDLNMPIMDGWQFLDEFIKIDPPKEISIFIVSSSIDPADHEKARSYDIVGDFIVKPVTIKDIQAMMSQKKGHLNP